MSRLKRLRDVFADVGSRGEVARCPCRAAPSSCCSCPSTGARSAEARRLLAPHDEQALGVRLQPERGRRRRARRPARACAPRGCSFSSSKRAFSSTIAATCLPLSAARTSACDDRRVAAGAVERLLDREHVGIVGRARRRDREPCRRTRRGDAGGRPTRGWWRTRLLVPGLALLALPSTAQTRSTLCHA